MTLKGLKRLSMNKICYKDQSDEYEDQKKSGEKIELRLKNNSINHFYLDNGKL